MPEVFERIRTRIATFYSGLSKNKKIAVIGGGAGAVVLLAFLIVMLTRTEYVPIAQGLTPSEAQVITTKLDDLGISWIDNGGTSVISVARADVSKAKMELAVFTDSRGFGWDDVLTNESITMTSQTREQLFIQALAGQITSSIETIDAVEKAAVILQIPKDSNYFIKDEMDSKASVVLTLRRGAALNEEQVSGIVNLIVSSVKGLTPDSVTILDTTGIQLNKPDTGLGFTANSQYDLQQKVKSQLQIELKDFLAKLYGRDNVDVQVSLALDFSKETERQKLFSPPIEGEVDGMVRSVTTITENVVGGAGMEGVPGTDSNTGEATSVTEGTDAGSRYEKASKTLNYELNEIQKEIVKSQGEIKMLSIGVLVNSKVLVDETLTDAHKTELQGLLSKAAGTKGDNIEVMAREFPDPSSVYDVYTGQAAAGMIPIWVVIVLGVFVLVAAGAVVLVLRRRRKAREAEAAAELARKTAEAEALDEIEDFGEDKGSPKYHIQKFVEKNPEAAATLLRSWLNEG